MTGETRTSLAVAGRKRQTVQTAHGRVFQKMEAATGNARRPAIDTWQTVWRDAQQLQRERPNKLQKASTQLIKNW